MSLTAYYLPANCLVEAFNKTIEKFLMKFLCLSLRDWKDKLSECLWAYLAIVRTPMKAILFLLVNRCEAILLLDIQISSLIASLMTKITDKEKYKLRHQELEKIPDASGPSSKSSFTRHVSP